MSMSELARTSALLTPTGGGRRMDAALRKAQVPGQLAAASIEGAAFATHVALSNAAMLSGAEGRALQYAPLGELRYQMIVDTFTGVACHKINRLAQQ